MNKKDNKPEVFDTLVCALIFIGTIFFIVLWLIGFGIIESFIYPGLEVILIPITCGLFLWALLNIRDNLNKEPRDKTKKLSYEDEQKVFDRKRVWQYHNKADMIFQQRNSFFLIAESMLLVSFVTTYVSKLVDDEIRLAIAALGVIITFCWFYVNVRLARRRRLLKFKYLEKIDEIYDEVMHFVRGFPASTALAYILPNSIILLWIFLFFYTLKIDSNILIIQIIPWSLFILIIISLAMRIFIPKPTRNN